MASEYRTRLEDEKLPAGPAPTGREPSPVAANDLPTYEESEAGEQRAVEVDTMNSTSQSRPRTNKAFGERFHKLSSAAGTPLNKLSNFVGAEGWWPTTTEKECDKAARILYSFTRESSLFCQLAPFLIDHLLTKPTQALASPPLQIPTAPNIPSVSPRSPSSRSLHRY